MIRRTYYRARYRLRRRLVDWALGLTLLVLLGSHGWQALYRAACESLQDEARTVCLAGGSLVDALQAVHGSVWRWVVWDPCIRAEQGVYTPECSGGAFER